MNSFYRSHIKHNFIYKVKSTKQIEKQIPGNDGKIKQHVPCTAEEVGCENP